LDGLSSALEYLLLIIASCGEFVTFRGKEINNLL
jgi:hypothetical protein